MALSMERHLTKSSANAYNPNKDVSSPFRRLHFVGIAAFWSRISQKEVDRPFRMPLWPLAPVIVVGFTGYALATQTTDFLIGELVLAGAAVVLWAASKLWRTSA